MTGPQAGATRAGTSGLASTWRRLARELSAFGTVGAVCFVVDLGIFQLLYAQVGTGAVTARLVSSLVSMTLAYFAHRHWSFAHRARRDPRREYLIFLIVNGVTLLLGLAAVAFVRYVLDQDSALALQITNVASIVLGTALRYFSYRQWVFLAHEPPAGRRAPDTSAGGLAA